MTKRAILAPGTMVTEHDVTDLSGHKLGNRCRAEDTEHPDWTDDERRCTFIIGHSTKHSWELTEAPPAEQDTLPPTKH